MRVEGNVLNATTDEPMSGVQVRIRVGRLEFTTHSGSTGNFNWSQDRSSEGKVVQVTVREAGFLLWQMTRDPGADEMPFQIRLQPEGERTTIVSFVVRDVDGNPVPGAGIQLDGHAGSITSAVSDARGEVRIAISETRLVEKGELRVDIGLLLQPSTTFVVFRVTDGDGRPLSDADVVVILGWQLLGHKLQLPPTDASRRSRVELKAGLRHRNAQYTVTLPGHDPERGDVRLEPHRVDIRMRRLAD